MHGNAEDEESSGAGAAAVVDGPQAESGYVILLFPAVLVSVHSKVYPCLINSTTGKAWRPSALGLWSLLPNASSQLLSRVGACMLEKKKAGKVFLLLPCVCGSCAVVSGLGSLRSLNQGPRSVG